MKTKLLLALAMLLFVVPTFVFAQDATYSLMATPVVTGLNFPVQAVQTPDDGWFVIERAGDLVRIHPDGSHETQVRLTNTNAWHERGALGVAIGHEGETWYIFVQRTIEYTPENPDDDELPRTGQITRFTLDDGYNVVTGTNTVILGSIIGDPETPSCDDFPSGTDCIPADGRTHAPGSLQSYQIGDHLVLLASEGEAAEDVTVNRDGLRAQDVNSLGGKILRIDFEGNGLPDNPFYTGNPADNASKVFAMGFRNPFTFTYWLIEDQLVVGVCDVGAQGYEEFDVAIGGENFGWPFREGPVPNQGYMDVFGAEATGTYVESAFSVDHADQGGAIVCGQIMPEAYGVLAGQMLYGGFGWPDIHLFDQATGDNTIIETTFMPATTIGYSLGNDGLLYAVDMVGTVNRLDLVQNEPLRTFTEPSYGYVVDVFDNQDFAGQIAYSTVADTIEYEWAEAAPFGQSFVDNFSVRVYNAFNAEFDADYLFTAFVDDGVRIYLDDQLILDEWHGSSGAYYEVRVPVTAGLHVVRFEYFDGAVNATLKADFYPAG
jgi:glucose/arabinose dehydrogenase